jgi:hypothetical protein
MRNMFGVFKISVFGIFILLISSQTFAADEHTLICQSETTKVNSYSKDGRENFNSTFRTNKYYELLEMSEEKFEKESVISNRPHTSKFVQDAGAAMPFWEAVRAHGICMINEMRRIRASKSSNSNQPQTNNSNQSQPSDSQQAQQLKQRAQESQQQAQQNQQRAEQEVQKGKRRRHEPENEAHHCLTLDKSGLFGGFINKCNFKISYSFCNYNPKKDSWADAHNCVGRAGNGDFVGAGRTSAAHIKNTETVYWFACKDPAWSLDTEYVPGQGLAGRCRTVGGN